MSPIGGIMMFWCFTTNSYPTRLRGFCTPNQKLTCFVLYLKIINTFLKNNLGILKQIVQRTQKWHWNFSRPSAFLAMDQNSQNIKTRWPT